MISRASEFISIFVKIYYLVSVCLEDMDVSCVLLTQNSNLSKSTYPYVTNGKRNISPDLCKFNECNQERKINSHVKYFREHFVPVRPSLSVSVRLNICCSVFIYLKTNQLLFILLACKTDATEKPGKPRVKLRSTQCNVRWSKLFTIFVMFFLIDIFGFKEIAQILLLKFFDFISELEVYFTIFCAIW